MSEPFPLLRRPIAIGPVELRNRVMMTAHSPRLPQRRYLRYVEERVREGVALVVLPAMYGLYDLPFGPGRSFAPSASDEDGVSPHPLSPEGIEHYGRSVATMAAQAEVVHRHGGRCVGQLYHPGAARHIDATHDSFQPPTSAGGQVDEYRRNASHRLSSDEIAVMVAAFGLAAGRAAAAGMDGVELHGCHGYLIAEFLSPVVNRRADAYGGSEEQRFRFLSEVIAAVRAEVGPGRAVGLRLNGTEGGPGGLDAEATGRVAARAQAAGADYVSVSGGSFGGIHHGAGDYAYVAPSYAPEATNVAAAAVIRQAVSVPVVVAGRIPDLSVAEAALAAGAADMVGLTRALMADHRIVSLSFAGRPESATPCIACNECHYGRPLSCAVNPAAGREEEMEVHRAEVGQTIVVIGGGPAGMTCAKVAAGRGHRVVLFERGRRLGGLLAVLGVDPLREGLGRYAAHLAGEVEAAGVELRLGESATVGAVAELRPDLVVLATGGEDRRPDLPGIGAAHVVAAAAVFADGPDALGERVVVVGGLDDHLGPLTVADLIARSGRQVTLTCEPFHAGQRIDAGTLHLLTARLHRLGVAFAPLHALAGVGDGWVDLRHTLTNQATRLDGVDSVVLAGHRAPSDTLAGPLRQAGLAVTVVGDALAPRRLVHATLDGVRAAQAI